MIPSQGIEEGSIPFTRSPMKLPLHKGMTNAEVAEVFTFIAKIFTLKPGNVYRTRAYEVAAEVVAHLPYSLAETFATSKPKKIAAYLQAHLEEVARVMGAGEKTMNIMLSDGHQVDVKFAPPAEWGSFLQYFTGNKQHNIALREAALKKGLSLSEHGIKIKKTGKQEKFATEEGFYNFIGYQLIPPEERAGEDELARYKQ